MSDHWESYMCHINEKPGTILLDFGIANDAPCPSLTELTCLTLRYKSARGDGFPHAEEFDLLNEIDDALETSASPAVYVGRSMSDGNRLYFFYSSDSSQTEANLAKAMAAYPQYRFEMKSKTDPEWTAYFEYLVPDARQYQCISNNHVLRALAEHGDNHAIEREVDHWAYFENSFDRAKFVEEVSKRDYRVVDETDDSENEPSFGVHLVKVHAVDPNTIDAMTIELFDCAEKHSGKYDGWETVIARN